jgi:hypothetical protein
MVTGCKMGMDVRLCAPEPASGPPRSLVATCRANRGRDRRAPDSSPRSVDEGRARAWTILLHRRLGLHGRAGSGVGRAHRAAQALPGQHGRRQEDRQPQRQVHALSCPPSTTARPRSARTSTRRPAWTAWRSPTRCSSPSARSSSPRPRTACTPSRRSWWPH